MTVCVVCVVLGYKKSWIQFFCPTQTTQTFDLSFFFSLRKEEEDGVRRGKAANRRQAEEEEAGLGFWGFRSRDGLGIRGLGF